jgi:hypothetical protein
MSTITTGMSDHRSDCSPLAGRPANPAADRLAALAAMTMTRQQPGLVLPALSGIPTSYTHTEGADTALTLARSLVHLGLGTAQMWERNNGNLSIFIRNSLNDWLRQIGAGSLENNVSLDFAIVDSLDASMGGAVDFDEGKLLILLETSDGCGFMTIGEQIELLEKVKPGLGRAFYEVLMKSMYAWMRVYDVHDAEEWVERCKESVEMDASYESRGESHEALSFEEYCRENEITFPDVAAQTPACLKVGKILGKSEHSKHVAILKQHRDGPYSEWIEPVLVMDLIRSPARQDSGPLRVQLEDAWDDGPLPNWLLAFHDHDAISQAFDEESENTNEYSHSPVWLDTFDPASVSDVRRVLTYVQRFIEVNINLVKLFNAIKKGSNHGSTNRSELDDELRAA